MNEKEMLMKQLRANAFPHNNGKVMQAINIIRHSYNRLTDVQQAAQIWGVSQDDFLDCINYLAMAKYIQLRTIADKILVPDFADIGWDLLEAKLTAEGISVLCHKTEAEMSAVSSWPLNGKKGGNRKHSKIDTLPPEMKATVEEMIMDGSATYSDIVTYLEQQGYSLSVSSVCRYAQGYVENLQTLQIAQANFRNMLDELERYPDLDTTEALVRVASQNLMTALTSKKDEDWSAVSVDKLMNQISGLTRAVAYKKRVELQNKSDIEAGTGDLKSALWSAMAKERPDLYKQVSAYLDRKAQEGGT